MELEAPDTPALDAARTEFTDIATNPANPRHNGYQRGDPQVSTYLDNLYKKTLPTPTIPPVPESQRFVSDTAADRKAQDDGTAPSLEDRAAQTQGGIMLRQTLGDDYDSEMSDMRIGASHLFSSPEGQQALTVLADSIVGLGPLAEVCGVRFYPRSARWSNHRNLTQEDEMNTFDNAVAAATQPDPRVREIKQTFLSGERSSVSCGPATRKRN